MLSLEPHILRILSMWLLYLRRSIINVSHFIILVLVVFTYPLKSFFRLFRQLCVNIFLLFNKVKYIIKMDKFVIRKKDQINTHEDMTTLSQVPSTSNAEENSRKRKKSEFIVRKYDENYLKFG